MASMATVTLSMVRWSVGRGVMYLSIRDQYSFSFLVHVCLSTIAVRGEQRWCFLPRRV